MAETDWTALTGAISSGSCLAGVTSGIARPSGGGSFVFGFATLDTTTGVVGYFANATDFAPSLKGGSVRGAIRRGLGGGDTNFAPFLFVGLQGPNTTDLAYMIGLSDESPSRIQLRKGALSGGLPGGVAVTSPPTSGVLAKSTATILRDTWVHLRLDVVVNLNGDVVLNAFQNDLGAHAVSSPTWAGISGIGQFIDDALQVNSGTAPLLNGRLGFGMQTHDVTRRAYVDYVEVLRQT